MSGVECSGEDADISASSTAISSGSTDESLVENIGRVSKEGIYSHACMHVVSSLILVVLLPAENVSTRRSRRRRADHSRQSTCTPKSSMLLEVKRLQEELWEMRKMREIESQLIAERFAFYESSHCHAIPLENTEVI